MLFVLLEVLSKEGKISLIFRAILPGGGAPETEISVRLHELALSVQGLKSYCVRAYADALEIIPYTLAENAGLNPINLVTELRNKHNSDEPFMGVNVKKVLNL